jgi:transposase-like protein
MTTLYDLENVLFDEKAARTYLLDKGIIERSATCNRCGEEMTLNLTRWSFRCNKRSCRVERTMNSGTFFAGTKLKTNEVLLLLRLWLAKVTFSSAVELTGHSEKTVVAFWGHFRQLVSQSLEEEDTIIGGEGVIVEVDETKLGKRKYNRGHRVDGVWVVVGVERTDARRVFVIPVESRDSLTLQRVVHTHVHAGSVVYTDLWKGYSWLNDRPYYSHGSVNHSRCFKDEATGVHTNTVEGTNAGIKRMIPVRSRVRLGMEERLAEFVWRRKHGESDPWNVLMEAIRDIHYD